MKVNYNLCLKYFYLGPIYSIEYFATPSSNFLTSVELIVLHTNGVTETLSFNGHSYIFTSVTELKLITVTYNKPAGSEG